MYIPVNAKQDGGIYPISYGYDDFENNPIRLAPRITNEYMLHFVIKGEGLLTLGNKKYPLKKGALFYCPPGVRLTYHTSETNPYAYYWITFYGDKADALLQGAGITALEPVMYPNSGDEIKRKLSELFHNANPKSCSFFVLSTLFSVLHLVSQDGKTEKTRNASLYVEHALDYLKSNFCDPALKVAHIAQFLHVTPQYISTIYREIKGKTLIAEIISLRMEKAKELLLEGKTPSGACFGSGYDDLSNFSKTFKKYFGVPPSEYAKD